ncbi:MAG: ATP-binding protein, partial [Ignavibacteria bacterium]|nr:ATP-binding protein [Ignavibacteria bacterium]
NYPYDALEEALCNAVYHRGYDNDSPIEVRIYPSRIDIISFPGPLLPIDNEKMKNYQFDVRKYRNRRIGEFLKELHLTEGRATGIPTIIKALEKNQSPKPIFETDDERTYFKSSFKIHPELFHSEFEIMATSQQLEDTKLLLSWDQVGTKSALSRHQVEELLRICEKEQPLIVLMNNFEWKDRTKFKKKFINPILELELLSMTIPDKPNSSKQKYITSIKGRKLLENLKKI